MVCTSMGRFNHEVQFLIKIWILSYLDLGNGLRNLPVLLNLHWLPVHRRISFKILLMTVKALKGQSPVYRS